MYSSFVVKVVVFFTFVQSWTSTGISGKGKYDKWMYMSQVLPWNSWIQDTIGFSDVVAVKVHYLDINDFLFKLIFVEIEHRKYLPYFRKKMFSVYHMAFSARL